MKTSLYKTGSLLAFAVMSTAVFAQYSFSATVGEGIPDGSGSFVPGATLSSSINASGVVGPIADVWVSFDRLSHTWIGDLHIRLVGPDSTTMDILSRPGRGTASTFGFFSDFVADNDYVFRDSGADLTHVTPPAQVASGTYRASSNPNDPATNTLAYAYTPTSFIDTWGGSDANGTWTLLINDYAGGDTGALGGWTLHVDTVPEPMTMTLLGAGALALLRRKRKQA